MHFTRKEKNGTLVLILFILLLVSIPFFYGLFFIETKTEETDLAEIISSLKAKEPDSVKQVYKTEYKKAIQQDKYWSNNNKPYNNEYELFYFDPNELPATEWKKLGVKEKTITTIQKYLSKGGKFRQPEDIKKIWSLHSTQVDRLLPYIKIKAVSNPAKNQPAYKSRIVETNRSLVSIDINNADSTAFDALPGIGGKLSQRIIAFREKLGGFYSPEQVSETFGLPDSTFKKIRERLRLGEIHLRQININTASLDELRLHPYIRYSLASAIVQFRDQHGLFTKIDDIKKIMTVNEEVYEKVSRYLAVL